MEKSIEILLKSIKVSTENLQYIAEETTGTNGMLLNSVIETLKAQTLVIKTISCKLDAEIAKKNRALDFICSKDLAYEFNNKK
jgi:uridylate kinase